MRLRFSLLFLCLFPIVLFGQEWYQIKTNFSGIAAAQYVPEINVLFIDQEGKEWYGSDGGLSLYHKGRWVTYTPENSSIPFQKVFGLSMDEDNDLYVAAEEGLFRKVNENWEELSWQVPFNGVNDVIAITKDSFFVASNNGFHKYVNGTWTFNTYPTLPSRYVRNIERAADSTIWATFDYAKLDGSGPFGFDGIGQYDGNEWVYNIRDPLFGVSGTIFPAALRDMAIDTSGKIWAASAKKGLLIIDLQDTSYVQIDASTAPFRNNTLLSIDIDSSNQVWIGAQTELLHYDPIIDEFEAVKTEDGPFTFTRYRQLYRAPNGALWTMANGEVGRLNPDGWEVVHSFVSDGLHGNRVWAMNCESDGNCYIGLEDRGIAITADGRWQASLLQENTFLENEARDFALGPNGEVYLATQNGLYYYEENTFVHLENIQNRLPYPIVTALEYDMERGGLWIATNGSRALGNGGSGQDAAGGLAFYRPATGGWEYFTPTYLEEFASYNMGYHIWDLELDDQGTLWVGSSAPTNPSYGILSAYDGNNWRTFDRLQNPVPANVTHLAAAPGGGVWFTGTNGGFAFTKDFVEVEVHTPNDANGNPVFGYRCIYYDEQSQSVYLGSSSPTRMLEYNGQDYNWMDFSEVPIDTFSGISAISKDEAGNLWVANNEEGIFLHNPNGVKFPNRVWPGDTNSDGLVNTDDILSLGLAIGKAGPARSSPTIFWEAQNSEDWPSFYPDGLNHKHADCDGNGLVEEIDLEVINENYDFKHPLAKGLSPGDLPDLKLVFSQDSLPAGGKVMADLVLGSTESPIADLHGLRFNLHLDSRFGVETTASLSSTSGWLLENEAPLAFLRADDAASIIAVALSRTDGQGQSGQGTIGQLELSLPNSNVKDWQLRIDEVMGITSNGFQRPIEGKQSTLVVSDQISTVSSLQPNSIRIYPSLLPLGQSKIFLDTKEIEGQLLLFGPNGSLLDRFALKNQISLDLRTAGLYFYQILDQTGQKIQVGKLLAH
ncbi:MAG: hypothetical protein HRU41_35335 [Saprospiraceae bacterium]|nr:hypothetical protein [Saprospiraceae bacterium]